MSAHSEIVCAKMLSHILQKGAQQVSDHLTIKNCLSKYAKDRQFSIKNQLILQSGIKREKLKAAKSYTQQSKPRSIEYDEYTPLQIQKIKNKKHKSNIQVQSQNKNTIKNKNHNKTQSKSKINSFINSKTTIQHEQYQGKSSSLISKMKSAIRTNQRQLERINIDDDMNSMMKVDDVQQERIQDQFRKQRKERQEQEVEESLRTTIEEQMKKQIKQKQIKQFNKQISEINTDFTFDINGKPIIFSSNLQKQSLKKQYPWCMKYKTSSQSYFLKCNITAKPIAERIAVKSKKTAVSRLSEDHDEDRESDKVSQINPCEESSDNNIVKTTTMSSRKVERMMIYTNNNQRQISSVPFFTPKEGTSFLQPETKRSAFGDRDTMKVQFSRRPKSGFIEFSRRAKTQKSTHSPKEKKKQTKTILEFSKTSKSQFFSKNNDNKHIIRRPKTCGNQRGFISNINEDLLSEMIV